VTVADESFSDDGAVHLLWRFITHRRLLDVEQFDMDDPVAVRAAAAEALAHADEFGDPT
jgi:hypothetical protein